MPWYTYILLTAIAALIATGLVALIKRFWRPFIRRIIRILDTISGKYFTNVENQNKKLQLFNSRWATAYKAQQQNTLPAVGEHLVKQQNAMRAMDKVMQEKEKAAGLWRITALVFCLEGIADYFVLMAMQYWTSPFATRKVKNEYGFQQISRLLNLSLYKHDAVFMSLASQETAPKITSIWKEFLGESFTLSSPVEYAQEVVKRIGTKYFENRQSISELLTDIIDPTEED